MTAASRLFVAGMLVGSLVVGSAADAIVGGEADGNRHPNVGSIFIMVDDFPLQWCSGTLIAPTVFLTAGHCFETTGDIYPAPPYVWGVTFDPDVTTMTTWYTGTANVHPNFVRHGMGLGPPYGLLYPDVAVVVLDSEVPDVMPAELPTENRLDVMQAQNELRGRLFESVGYGVGGTIKPRNQDWSVQYRQVAILNFQSLRKTNMLLTNNKIKNLEGICFGDSGGPNFFEGTDLIASITQRTNSLSCNNTDGTQRIDTPEVREFLAEFVELP